jgi:ABC-type antimicrobial peptide transport system permease subunit
LDVAEVDRMLPLIDLKTMESQIDDDLAQERQFASLVSLFGAVSLALACVGLYGMVPFSVAARTREIGLRMALGAGRGAVLRMILGQVAATAAAGLALGLPATWALTRIVEAQLYGVKAHDPATLALGRPACWRFRWAQRAFRRSAPRASIRCGPCGTNELRMWAGASACRPYQGTE